MSVHVPLMIRIEASHNPRIPVSMGNPVSCVQVGGNDSMSFAPSGKMPGLCLIPDNLSPVPKILVK